MITTGGTEILVQKAIERDFSTDIFKKLKF